MESIDRLSRTLLILLLITAIIMQVRLTYVFFKYKDTLDADPLAVGANRYGIDLCECFVSNSTSIIFNKSGSFTKTIQKGFNYNQQINISWDKLK